MTTVIRLDATAITRLLEIDPDFKLELQRAVVTEITRKLYDTDVVSDMQKVIKECFKKHHDDFVKAVSEDNGLRARLDERMSAMLQSVRSGSWGAVTGKKLSPELIKMLDEHVAGMLRDEIKKQMGSVTNIVEKAKKDVEENVIQRIGKIGGVIEHNTKVEMLRQVRADVADLIGKTLGDGK